MPIVNKENSTGIVANVLHPVLYVQGARGEMTVSTEQPEKHLFFKLLNLTAEDFGDPEFKRTYGLYYALYSSTSTDQAIALGKTGFMGSVCPGGQSLEDVAWEIDKMKAALGEKTFLVNMRSDCSADMQMDLVRLLIDKGVPGVETSSILAPTEALVYYRVKGIREENGKIIVPHKIIARVSREEALENFVSPPAARIVADLLDGGRITAQEAILASRVPMADDITVEAVSGGRPMVSALPAFRALVNRKQAEFGYQQKVRLGAAGCGTGAGCLAAFEMGAAYVVTCGADMFGVEKFTGDTPPENRHVDTVARLLLKSCAYRYMKNLLTRMGANPDSFADDIIQ